MRSDELPAYWMPESIRKHPQPADIGCSSTAVYLDGPRIPELDRFMASIYAMPLDKPGPERHAPNHRARYADDIEF